MSIAEAFLAEFQQEAQTTRKFLERIPGDKLSWKPHEKSLSAGQLALHIAQTPGQVMQMALPDVAPMPDFGGGFAEAKSVDELLTAHDESVAIVTEALPKVEDARMHATWRLEQDGKTVLEMPRVSVLRMILLNHWIHHRGQFGVYLRLTGAKVPSSYGPSGDEQPDFAAPA